MKKGLYGFTAFVMALTLVGCGADKNKSSDKESKSSKSKATALSDEKKDTNKDSKKSEKSTKAVNIPDIKTYAGEYMKNGHGSWGELPDDLKPDNIEEALKKDPMTISEDGVLHFCGQDYKLVAEGENDGSNFYSIEGSDFDFAKYCKSISSKYVAKNYEGPVFLTEEETHMTFNGEDVSYVNLLLYISPKGDTTCPEYISFQLKDGGYDDWSSDWDWDDDSDFDWDDWDDEDENTEEENNNTNNDRARKQISFG